MLLDVHIYLSKNKFRKINFQIFSVINLIDELEVHLFREEEVEIAYNGVVFEVVVNGVMGADRERD